MSKYYRLNVIEVKKRRDALGKTNSQIEKETGAGYFSLLNWLAEAQTPNQPQLRRLARCLKCEISELLL